jgi:hypothetical protein
MAGGTRTPSARCALAAVALSIASALVPAGALASGPGVTVFSKDRAQPITLSGAQIAAAADVPARAYTLRERPGSAGRTIRLGGLSVRGLLRLAGIAPSSVRFVSVVRANGSLAVLRHSDLGGFAEGPALVSDDGSSTRFFRPARSSGGTTDNVVSSSAGPLEITVDGGTLLAVKATASARKVQRGKPVTFSARVRFPPPGAQITYRWNFGDGTTAVGQRVTHSFDVDAEQQVQVSARGTNGSTAICATICGGVAAVDVRVGNPRAAPDAPDAGSPGSGTGNPQAAGSGTGVGAGGVGGSGGGTTPGANGTTDVQAVVRELARQRARQHARERAAARRLREAAQREAVAERALDRAAPAERTRPLLTVTGVLLAGQGAAITGKLPPPPAEQPAGSPKGAQAARGGAQDDSTPVPVTALLAFLVIVLGALRERRGVRLRIA